jgi:putative Holliday junction resolvase
MAVNIRDCRHHRVIGLDWGTKKIGVAISDTAWILSVPRASIENRGDFEAIVAKLATLIEETGAKLIVIGMPVALSGEIDVAGQKVFEICEAIKKTFPDVQLVTEDERYTSKMAETLEIKGLEIKKDDLDSRAACIILQSFLDKYRETV